MGLSSSQARLLSITARLTDNEYRTQRLTNARLKLTDISDAARVQYQDALNSDKFVYMAFDGFGSKYNTDLTPSVLYQYQPSKNQYALVNNANKILVSSTDAANFRQTDNLAEFLKRYDVLDNVSTTTYYMETVPASQEVPNPAHALWEDECAAIDKQKAADRAAHDNWTPAPPPGEWDEEVEKARYTSTVHHPDWQIVESEEGVSMYEQFRHASKSCYDNAVNMTNMHCYLHVLAHMLDLDVTALNAALHSAHYEDYVRRYETSVPGAFSQFNSLEIINSAIFEHATTPEMQPISDIIANGYTPSGGETQIIYTAEHHANDSSSEPDKLVSDYYLQKSKSDPSFELTDEMILSSNYTFDSSGNIVNKTLKQKCIDLFYLADTFWESIYYQDRAAYQRYFPEKLIPFIKTFQEDMELTINGISVVDKGYDETQFAETMYEIAKQNHEYAVEHYVEGEAPPFDENDPKYNYPEEPPLTIIEDTSTQVPRNKVEEKLEIVDPEKAQWYTNLWYRMNGMDEPEKINKEISEVTNATTFEETAKTDYLLTLFDLKKQTNFQNYDVIDSRLMSSKDWLNNALSQGLVTMEKVGTSRTTSKDTLKWSSIIYTNATDIISQQDDNKIAQAEAHYNQVLSEVNAKDKMFENKIRKLDTEHNALQTEYNSVKSAMDKNIERSFKVFQG